MSSGATTVSSLLGSVLMETSMGPVVFDLYGHDCPLGAANFLNLCEIQFFSGSYVHHVLRDNYCCFSNAFLSHAPYCSFQGLANGDANLRVQHEMENQRSGPWLVQRGERNRNEWSKVARAGYERRVRIDKAGLLLAVHPADTKFPDAYYVTLTNRHLFELEGHCTVLGECSEGLETIKKINSVALRSQASGKADPSIDVNEGAPLRIIRFYRSTVLHNPFPAKADETERALSTLSQLYNASPKTCGGVMLPLLPPNVPQYNPAFCGDFLFSDCDDEEEKTSAEDLKRIAAEEQKERLASTRTLMLQVLGALPDDSTLRPPETILFVCKLNPFTNADDLSTIFSQFGKVRSCEVIKDAKTGNSLQYAFVEYETKEACERAYLKMDGVLIDNCRVHVDFCQSVAKVWAARRKK